jgi:hypothetical protein
MFNQIKHSEFIKNKSLDLVLCLFIGLIGIFYTEQIRQFLDVSLYDESSYLKYGLDFFEERPLAEAAPLYAFWYKLLSFVESDAVDLYYLNYRLMTILPAISLFVFFRVARIHQFYALAATVWMLCMPGNFFIWPKVSHFALIIFLIGSAIAFRQKDLFRKISIFFITFLSIAYVRPEYFISATILFLLLLLIFLKNIKRGEFSHPRTRMFIISAVLFVLCLSNLGNPMASGERSMLAFGQHFSLNQARVLLQDQNPWTNWESTVKLYFGDAKQISSSLSANPSAFLWHVTENFKNLPKNVASTFLQTSPKSDVRKIEYFQVFVTAAGLALLLASYGFYLCRVKTVGYSIRFYLEKINIAEKIMLFIFLTPSAITVLVIYPRQHHIFLAGWIAISYLAVCIGKNQANYFLQKKEMLLLLVACILLTLKQIPPQIESNRFPTLTTIKFLRTLNVSTKVNILEAEGGFHIYLSSNFKRVAEYDKHQPWNVFLKKHDINMIVVTQNLLSDPRFKSDHEWLHFLKNPTKYGFSEIQIPHVPDRKIFYKNDLNITMFNSGLIKYPKSVYIVA